MVNGELIKMKRRRKVYILFGAILIFLNLIVDLAEIAERRYLQNDASYTVGYFIGSHILAIFGLLLLRNASKLKRKIKFYNDAEMVKSIGTIGNTEDQNS